MENVKLPNIKRLKAVKQRLKKLPQQESATDTSNWENRNVSAVTFDTETKTKKVRDIEFIRPKEIDTSNRLTLKQVKKLEEQERNKKTD